MSHVAAGVAEHRSKFAASWVKNSQVSGKPQTNQLYKFEFPLPKDALCQV